MNVMQAINDQMQWNRILLNQPTQSGIFLQSWQWGEFQEAVGRRVYRYRVHDGFAQVIELSLPMGKKYWFIPRGVPIDGLEEKARKQGVLFVRFEPLQPLQPLRPTSYVLCPTKSISPPQTLIIDLTKSEEELLAGMHEKTRYNIRLAVRKGVRCQVTGMGDFEQFWKLMQETAKRDKFRTHPREYYKKMIEVLGGKPSPGLRPPSPDGRGEGEGRSSRVMSVRLHMAYHGLTPIAAAIVGYFGDTATYLHGASSYEHRAMMAPYAMHWLIMQEAKKDGYKFYDFWGVDERRWAGMTRFKMGFATVGSPDRSVGSGTLVDYPGTFDLPLNRFWYTLYRLGRRLR